MKKRIMALVLAVLMIVSLLPVSAFAEEEHEHEYTAEVVSPTCTEGGHTVYTCACGDSYVTDETAALGHSIEKVEALAPTCTEAGHIEYWHCTACGVCFADEDCMQEIEEEDTVLAARHDLILHEAKAPTATEPGWEAYDTCTKCDYSTYIKLSVTEEPAGEVLENSEQSIPEETERQDDLEELENVEDAELGLPEEAPTLMMSLGATSPIASGECGAEGDNLTWSLSSDGVLSISGTGDMNDYSSNYSNGVYRTTAPWGSYYTDIEKVEIESGVTSVGSYAFRGCSAVTSTVIPESVTELGSYAFANCSSLAEVVIPEGVTAVGSDAFYYCTGLETVEIPGTVENIGSYAFSNCSSLAEVVIPEGVTGIGYDAFYYCSSLESVTIPGTVTSVGSGAFSGCPLKDVTYAGSWEDYKEILSQLPESVMHCNAGKEITITFDAAGGTVEPASVTIDAAGTYDGLPVPVREGYTFLGWSLSVSGELIRSNMVVDQDGEITLVAQWLSGEGVTISAQGSVNNNIEWSLYSNGTLVINGAGALPNYSESSAAPWYLKRTKVTEVQVRGKITCIGDFAFKNCTNLVSVSMPATIAALGENAFEGCSKLVDISIPSAVTSIGGHCFADCKALTGIELPASLTYLGGSVRTYSDGSYWISGEGYSFYNCTSLQSITIPSGVTSIGVGGFEGCSKLEQVILHEGIVAIGSEAFYGCSSLSSIELPAGLKEIPSDCFYGCKSLKAVTVPEGVVSLGYYAFYGCKALESIDLPDSLLTISDSVFANCSALTNIHMPIGVSKIPNGAFTGCKSLKEMPIHEGITSIGSSAFSGCISLKTVVWPENVDKIQGSEFEGCSGLTSIVIPEGVISIEYYAFYSCSNLTELTIPDSVTDIGRSICYNCSNLKDIWYGDTFAQWMIDCEDTKASFPSGCTLHTADMNILDYGGFCRYNPNGGYSGEENYIASYVIDEDGKMTVSPLEQTCQETVDIFLTPTSRRSSALVTNLIIENGITSFYIVPFDNFQNLRTVYFPASLTEVQSETNMPSWRLAEFSYGGNQVQWAAVTMNTSLRAWLSKSSSVKYNVTAPEHADPVYVESITIVAPDNVNNGCVANGTGGWFNAVVSPANAWYQNMIWSVENITGEAYMQSDGYLEARAPGLVRVTATSPDKNHVSASMDIEIIDYSVAIEGPDTLVSGAKANLTVSYTPDKQPGTQLYWSMKPGDGVYASVSSAGVLTAGAVKAPTTVTVCLSAYSSYNTLTAEKQITILPLASAITLSDENGEDCTGKTLVLDMAGREPATWQFTAAASPEGAMQSSVWTSSAAAVMTVDQTGLITVLKAGTATITAAASDGSGVKTTVTLQAKELPQELEIPEIAGTGSVDSETVKELLTGDEIYDEKAIAFGVVSGSKALQLKATDPATGNAVAAADAVWALVGDNDATYATLTSDGKLTAKVVNEAQLLTVRLSIKGNDVSQILYVVVYPKATIIDIVDGTGCKYKNNMAMEPGQALVLHADVWPKDALQDVTWKSSSAKIATIDKNGVVTPVKAGTATFTATAADGSKITASLAVKIAVPAEEIQYTAMPENMTLASGSSFQLKASVLPATASDKKVTFKLESDTPYATLTAAGKLTTKACYTDQQILIGIYSQDGAVYRQETITLLHAALTTPNIFLGETPYANKKAATLDMGLNDRVPLRMGTEYNAPLQAAWTSSDTAVAVIEGDELVLKAAGKITLTGSADGTVVSVPVTVKKTDRIVSVDILSATEGYTVVSGKTLALNAVVTYESGKTASAATWSCDSEGGYQFATVSSKGVVTGAKNISAPCKVYVTATAKNEVSSATVTKEITVIPADTGVSIFCNLNGKVTEQTDNTVNIDMRTTGQVELSAKVYPNNGCKDVTWKSSSTKVATVDENGVVTFLGTGKVTITATTTDGTKKVGKVTLSVVRLMTEISLSETAQVYGGKSVTLKATAGPDDTTNKKLVWSLSGEGAGYCTISTSGVLKTKAVSTETHVMVTATAADGSGVSSQCEVTILPLSTSVQLWVLNDQGQLAGDISNMTVSDYAGNTYVFQAIALPGDHDRSFEWKLSKSGTVDLIDLGNGVVMITGMKPGTVSVTATVQDGSKKSAKITLKILEGTSPYYPPEAVPAVEAPAAEAAGPANNP